MAPPERLWEQFARFDGVQLSAMADMMTQIHIKPQVRNLIIILMMIITYIEYQSAIYVLINVDFFTFMKYEYKILHSKHHT